MQYVVLSEENDEFAHLRRQRMADQRNFLLDHGNLIDAAGPLNDATTAASAGGIWIAD